MAKYQSSSCGHCGVNWQFMGSNDTNIGPPKVKCRSCNQINSTKMYLYRDANWFGKLYYWISLLFNTILFSGVALAVGIGGLMGKFESGIIGYVVGVISLTISLFMFKNIMRIPKNIQVLEKLYDRNGGFLWSDQYY